ncbi:MAG: SDR family oxidoreductase [Rhodospirillales bacterium]|nr:SDR family oxidoreductase [Rhodospirillales bacterium]
MTDTGATATGAPADGTQRRVALVTGAASGVGACIAAALHGAGYRVAVTDLDAAAANTVAAHLDPSADTAFGLALDVREKPAFEHALAALLARWGAAHVLVNNAAMTVARPVMEIPPEEFDAVMAVNVRGTFLGCQVFGTHFRAQGHGRIVNMASLAGQNGGTATGAHYAASKGAIMTLTKVFARDLAAGGVTVNAVAPGPLDTPMVHRTVPAERMGAMRAAIPVGEIGDPRFVASLVVQLASPEAAFTTGATWDVNGGLYMR